MSVTRRECLLGVAGVLATRVAAGSDGRVNRSLAREIDSICRNHIGTGAAAGLVVQVQYNESSFARGYGYANLETGTLATPQTVFRIGSVSKQFAAAAIVLLAEDGKLSLEDPVSKYLPHFPRADEVHIRQLLNHTSGISNISAGVIPCIDYTTDQLVEIITRQQPLYAFDPGTRWSYSNTGFVLAGSVIEKISGHAYWDFYTERLFKPAGLTSTAIDRHADIVLHRASGYGFPEGGGGFVNAPYLSSTIAGPAGALRSTAADLARWHSALFHGRILEPESLREMTTPARLKDGRLGSEGRTGPVGGPHPVQEYGLGFELSQVKGQRLVGHYGSILGFAADMGTFPELGVTVVVLTNSELSSQNPPRNIDDAVVA